MIQAFKHKTPIQVRFKDVDAFRHVNNANHFTYLEIARSHYFNEIIGKEIDWTEKGIILVKAEINYKQPILLADTIFVYTKCSGMGNKSFELSYRIVKVEKGLEIIMAEAITVLVAFNYKQTTSIPVPEEWKKKINAYEKQNF